MATHLPNGDRAILDIRKLEDYCLSPSHPRGRHKARVFQRVLGVQQGMRFGYGRRCWKLQPLVTPRGSTPTLGERSGSSMFPSGDIGSMPW